MPFAKKTLQRSRVDINGHYYMLDFKENALKTVNKEYRRCCTICHKTKCCTKKKEVCLSEIISKKERE